MATDKGNSSDLELGKMLKREASTTVKGRSQIHSTCLGGGGDNNYLCTYDLYSPVHNVLDYEGMWEGVFWALGNGSEPIGEYHFPGPQVHK